MCVCCIECTGKRTTARYPANSDLRSMVDFEFLDFFVVRSLKNTLKFGIFKPFFEIFTSGFWVLGKVVLGFS